MLLFGAIVAVVLAPFASGKSDPPPIVTTSNGNLFGRRLPGAQGDGSVSVEEYLGIPFGERTERWESPHDFRGNYSSDPFNATMWGRACLQVLSDTSTYGSEDCLRANVWTPARNRSEKKKAVMVFIYGGSNQFGEAEPYNMSALAAYHDVVAVNFNYRTGPIGWLAFAEDVADNRSTGNYGIEDIQSALRWVQREIGAFGGDNSRVAIHGQSSGGGLVELQYVSPQSNGLFHGAISESGGLSAMPLKDALHVSARAAEMTGCASAASPKRCMQQLPGLNVTSLTYALSWGPVVDGVTIPYDPMSMLSDGNINPIRAAVFGAQTNDSFLFLSRSYTRDGLPQPNDYPNGALRSISAAEYEEAVRSSVPGAFVSDVLALYPPVDEAKGKGSVQNVHSLGRIESDQMHCALRRRARLFNNASSTGGAFAYRFDYWYQSSPTCSAVPNFHRPYLGAVHQDEVTFVLGQPNFMEDGSCCGAWGLSEGEESCAKISECVDCYNETFGSGYRAYFDAKEFSFAQDIGRLWTNVAVHGDPNGGTSLSKRAWPREGGVVLSADIPGGLAVESELYGDPRVCRLWDAAIEG